MAVTHWGTQMILLSQTAKISEYHLIASSGELSMVHQWCDRIQLSYQSTKDGNSSIYNEEGFKGPEGANPLWTHTAADYQGQMPLTYSRQEIDMESTAE